MWRRREVEKKEAKQEKIEKEKKLPGCKCCKDQQLLLVEGGQLLLHRRTWHCTYSTAVGVVADGVMRMNTDFDDDLASLHPSSDNMTVEKYNFSKF